MLQNHLLQVLCLVAMEPPADLGEAALRDARLAVLRATHPPAPEEMAQRTVRGRYTAGTVDGHEVPAYADADGVDPSRETETFAQATLSIDSWRWAGVPVTLRSGKALGAHRALVRVRFRDVPHPVFADAGPSHPCDLRISMRPPAFEVDVRVNTDGELFGLETATLHTDLPEPVRSPYAGLVLDVLRGDRTLFVSGDEAEQAWRIMDPVLAAWAADEVPLRPYAAGSDGPV
jgi:glucose-6-phosphate 1-dehydrogenase